MSRARDTIEGLRITYHKLEQQEASYTPEDFAELKRILLNRIAALELAETVASDPPPADLATPAELAAEILAVQSPEAEISPPAEPPAATPPTIPEANTPEAPDSRTNLKSSTDADPGLEPME